MDFWDLLFALLIFVPLGIIWAGAVFDIFGRRDLNGVSKALWLVVVIVLPLLGTLVYMIARPAQPAEVEAARAHLREFVAVNPSEELERLVKLRDAGTLTDEEFAKLKAKVVG